MNNNVTLEIGAKGQILVFKIRVGEESRKHSTIDQMKNKAPSL